MISPRDRSRDHPTDSGFVISRMWNRIHDERRSRHFCSVGGFLHAIVDFAVRMDSMVEKFSEINYRDRTKFKGENIWKWL